MSSRAHFSFLTSSSLLRGPSRFSVEINFVCNTDRKSWTFDPRAHGDLAAISGFPAEVLDLKYFSESGFWNVQLAPDQLKDSGVATIFGPPASKLFGPLAQWVTATARFSTPFFFKSLILFSGQVPSAARVSAVAGPRYASVQDCAKYLFHELSAYNCQEMHGITRELSVHQSVLRSIGVMIERSEVFERRTITESVLILEWERNEYCIFCE